MIPWEISPLNLPLSGTEARSAPAISIAIYGTAPRLNKPIPECTLAIQARLAEIRQGRVLIMRLMMTAAWDIYASCSLFTHSAALLKLVNQRPTVTSLLFSFFLLLFVQFQGLGLLLRLLCQHCGKEYYPLTNAFTQEQEKKRLVKMDSAISLKKELWFFNFLLYLNKTKPK